MSKIPSVEVPSDDCAVQYAGETYYPHAGESVSVWPNHSLQLYRVLMELNGLQGRIAALEGEPNAAEESLRLVEGAFSNLAEELAPYLEHWTWTDKAGRPMPALDGTAGPLRRLDVEELQWLVGAVRGETAQTRKND